jgi:hypothetical protein
MKNSTRIILSFIIICLTAYSCNNPEQSKTFAILDHYSDVIDEMQLQFDGLKDTIPDSLVLKMKEIENRLTDSVDFYNRSLELSIKIAKFNKKAHDTIMAEFNDIKLEANGLKQQVINKQVEYVIKSLENQKLKLTEKLKQINDYTPDIRKTMEKSIHDQLFIIDSTMDDLKIQLNKRLQDLKAEADGIASGSILE